MYRTEDRRKAIGLRLRGLSYEQIKKIVPASNGVLSYWLKDYPLTEEQKKKLYGQRDLWVERFRDSMRKKREKRMVEIHNDQKKFLGKILKRDMFVAGIFLYWGEGQKGGNSVSLSNTNPAMIDFFLKWLEICFGISRKDKKVRIYLHLYSDMSITQEFNYWSKKLGVTKKQFAKPYIKESMRASLDYKSWGHGTCRIQLGNVKIKEQILAAIRIFSEFASGSSFNGSDPILIKS